MPGARLPGDKDANLELLEKLLDSLSRAVVATDGATSVAGPAQEQDVEAQVKGARAAIKQVIERIGKQDDPVLLAPGFASHGPDHPMALCDRFCELLECGLISLMDYSKPERVDIILWSLLAFVFHDVGMVIFPTGPQSDTERDSLADAWAAETVRWGHDSRSLEFVEATLVSNVTDLPAWCDYWGDRLHVRDAGMFELYVLARICQSHGDADDDWLDEQALGTYSRQVGTDTPDVEFDRDLQFVRLFGEENWSRLSPAVFAAATILNLVDLLDIRPNRSHSANSDAVWRASLPDAPEARQQRFLHWLGNKYCTVKIKQDGIDVETHPPVNTDEMSVLREVLLDTTGPVATLLEYGRSPRMAKALEKYLGVTRLDIRVRRGQSHAWAPAELEALRMPPGTWPLDDGERDGVEKQRELFDVLVTKPTWFRLVCDSLSTESRTAIRDLSPTLAAALDARVQGLVMEDAYEIDTRALPGTTAYAMDVSSPSNYRTDSFFAGLRLARVLASQSSNGTSSEAVRVLVAAPTSDLFSELTKGNWRPAGPTVILVLLDRSDPADMSKMIGSLDLSHTKLVFVLSRPQLLSEVSTLSNVAVIRAEYREAAGADLSRKVECLSLDEDGKEFSLQLRPTSLLEAPTADEPGVGYLVRQWITAKRDSLFGLIQFHVQDKGSTRRYAVGQGALVLLHMAEARRLGENSEEATQEAVFRDFAAALRVPGVGDAVAPLGDIVYKFPFAAYAASFIPWASDSDHKTRLDAMDVHRKALSEAASAMLLFDALTMIAVGQAFNPQHIDWKALDRVIYPALRAGVKSALVGEGGLVIGGAVAIPLAANAAEALGDAERWHLARTVGQWGASVGGDEGLVCFQVVYRLLRPSVATELRGASAKRPKPALALEYLPEPEESVTFLLGCLEAVCSGTVTRDAASLEVGRAAVNHISSQITQGPFLEIDVRMGFDVLFTYRELKGRTGLVLDDNLLWRLGVEERWDEQCRGIRSTPKATVDPDFEALRARFDELQNCTPGRFKRENPPDSSHAELRDPPPTELGEE